VPCNNISLFVIHLSTVVLFNVSCTEGSTPDWYVAGVKAEGGRGKES